MKQNSAKEKLDNKKLSARISSNARKILSLECDLDILSVMSQPTKTKKGCNSRKAMKNSKPVVEKKLEGSNTNKEISLVSVGGSKQTICSITEFDLILSGANNNQISKQEVVKKKKRGNNLTRSTDPTLPPNSRISKRKSAEIMPHLPAKRARKQHNKERHPDIDKNQQQTKVSNSRSIINPSVLLKNEIKINRSVSSLNKHKLNEMDTSMRRFQRLKCTPVVNISCTSIKRKSVSQQESVQSKKITAEQPVKETVARKIKKQTDLLANPTEEPDLKKSKIKEKGHSKRSSSATELEKISVKESIKKAVAKKGGPKQKKKPAGSNSKHNAERSIIKDSNNIKDSEKAERHRPLSTSMTPAVLNSRKRKRRTPTFVSPRTRKVSPFAVSVRAQRKLIKDTPVNKNNKEKVLVSSKFAALAEDPLSSSFVKEAFQKHTRRHTFPKTTGSKSSTRGKTKKTLKRKEPSKRETKATLPTPDISLVPVDSITTFFKKRPKSAPTARKKRPKSQDGSLAVPKKGTLKHKRWLMNALKERNEGTYEDDIFEGHKFATPFPILSTEDEDESDCSIATPKFGFVLTPVLPKKGPRFKALISPARLLKARKCAEEYMFKRQNIKWRDGSPKEKTSKCKQVTEKKKLEFREAMEKIQALQKKFEADSVECDDDEEIDNYFNDSS